MLAVVPLGMGFEHHSMRPLTLRKTARAPLPPCRLLYY